MSNLNDLNGYPICKSATITKFEFSTASDASDRGFFSYRVHSLKKVFSSPFTAVESEESSTFKELTAVPETWCNEDVFVDFEGKTVGHFTDNKAVVLDSLSYNSLL